MIERAYIGCYSSEAAPGGIRVFEPDANGDLQERASIGHGLEAGYLCFGGNGRYLYAVDERKTDGRGPVGNRASIWAFEVNAADGSLAPLNSQPALGAFPTYISPDPRGEFIVAASHGSFDHVEQIVEIEGRWATTYLYDDSSVCLYPTASDGRVEEVADVHTFRGHGLDPGPWAQAEGHPQASSHIHSAQFDPTGAFVVACDKGTDQIHVFRVDRSARRLVPACTWFGPPGSAPRHPAFHPGGALLFVTNELASTVSTFRFELNGPRFTELATSGATAPAFTGPNEPADIRAHPQGRYVVVNNRGEDTVVSFRIWGGGVLRPVHAVGLSPSPHPGLAARCVCFTADGQQLLVADRPANLIRHYDFDPETGSMTASGETPVSQPGFILLAGDSESCGPADPGQPAPPAS